jgi:hypothetical protein
MNGSIHRERTAPATQCGYSSSKSKRSIQVKPVILKQALDFKQLGHDRVACHRGMVDDSSAARAIKTALCVPKTLSELMT